MRLLFTFLFALLLSCNAASNIAKDIYVGITPPLQIDESLEFYLQMFKDDAEMYGVPLIAEESLKKVVYGDTAKLNNNEDTIGICVILQTWTIDVELWKEITVTPILDSNLSYKLLMYHEFAHCLLDQDHVDDPMDLMNPILTPERSAQVDKVIVNFFQRMKQTL